MPVTGDPSQLAKLAQRLQKLAGVPQRAAVKFAPVLKDFLATEFAQGVDPFGDPWKPLAGNTLKKGRHPPPLTDTGAARDALTVVPSGARDRASLPGYLKYHLQTGRAVLPLRGESWPEAWARSIKDALNKAAREIAEGKG